MWSDVLLFVLKIFIIFVFIFCISFMIELVFFDDLDHCEGGKVVFSNSDVVLCQELDNYYIEKKE